MNLYILVARAALVAAMPLVAGCAQARVFAAELPPTPAISASVLREIDRYFTDQSANRGFSGAVLIGHDGRVLLEKGYGLANRETQEPVTPDTRFNLGSLDKFITRIAVFQLIEAGKLSLDETVGEILPAYPNPVVREQVTVKHLLDMQSGIALSPRRFLERAAELRTTDDYLDLFATDELRFAPGSRTEYSNGAYIVLGKIIEQITGTSYDAYVHRHITGPLNMTRTSLTAAQPGQGYAIGYTRGIPNSRGERTGPLVPNSDRLAAHGSSMGGGYSTVRDFARLADAVREGQLIGQNSREAFFSVWPGYCSGLEPAGWNGGFLGVSTSFSMWVDGTTVIIFTNQDPPLARVARDTVFKLLDRPVEAEDE